MEKELIYAYVYPYDYHFTAEFPIIYYTMLRHILSQSEKIDGVMFVIPDLKSLDNKWELEGLQKFSRECKRNDLDLIIHPLTLKLKQFYPYFSRLKTLSNRISVSINGTWLAWKVEAQKYKELADKYEYEWVCPLDYGVLRTCASDDHCYDSLINELKDTFCISCMSYLLAAVLYKPGILAKSHPGYESNLLKDNPGLTLKKLRDFVTPLNIISGVGFQKGLDLGVRDCLRETGFNGFLVGIPFDLKNTKGIIK